MEWHCEIKTQDPHISRLYKRHGVFFTDYSSFTCCDLLDETDVDDSGPVADRRALLKIAHWALVKYNYRLNLKSKFMQETFQYVERSPLLCILEDFLPEMDHLFQKHEEDPPHKDNGSGESQHDEGDRPHDLQRDEGDRSHDLQRDEGEGSHDLQRDEGEGSHARQHDEGDRPHARQRDEGEGSHDRQRDGWDRSHDLQRDEGDRSHDLQRDGGDRSHDLQRDEGDRSHDLQRDEGDRPHGLQRDEGDRSHDLQRDEGEGSHDLQRDEGEGSHDLQRDEGEGSHDRQCDEGEGSHDRQRDGGEGSHDRQRDGGEGSHDRQRDEGEGSHDRQRDEGDRSHDRQCDGGDVDGCYVEVLELYSLVRQRLLDVRHNWRNIVATVFKDHGKYAGFASEYYFTMVDVLLLLVGHLTSLLLQRREGRAPRFVRLCERLGLSKKETECFSYLFIHNTGVLFAKLHSKFSSPPGSSSTFGGSRPTSMALAAAHFAAMNGKEMLEFFDLSRPHMKQELLEPDDEFSSIATTAFLKIPNPVLKACCGCTLPADELYKIDKTAMAEVLAEEQPTEVKVPQGVYPEAKSPPVDSESEGKEELSLELEDILKTCDQIQQSVAGADEGAGSVDSSKPLPYKTDLEYLEDNFELIETLVKARKTEMSDDSLLLRPDQRKPEAVIREMKAKARSLRAKIDRRMEATHNTGAWLPRLERLGDLRKLDVFDKNVLLILTGSMVSRNLRNSGNHGDAIFGHHLNIGSLIGLFCEGLQEQIQSRVYFYKNSKLVSEGLIHVHDPPLHSRGNFLDSVVELDRRLLDYIVGLDTEINELVDGSDLYTPEVTMRDVALPEEHRQLLMSTFQSFELFKKTCKELGLNTKGATRGLCLLFYGPSGTGKTMTANAVANYLGKKVLLVTVSVLMEKDLTKDLLRFLFRESKIHNAVLFFDECESLFESRDNRPNIVLGLMLTEIEQYDGIIILATNRHQDLDEAMHRRIQLSLPFSVPDYALRVEIWKSHVPKAVASGDIDWTNLAIGSELTGGLIRNAVLSAVSLSINQSNEGKPLVVREEHLSMGAKLQLRGLLEMVDFERRVIPTFGITDLVLDTTTEEQVDLILNTGKKQKFISAQWGFGTGGENVAHPSGIICLVCGAPGTGKSAIAHALAYELGQPIKEASCTELLSHSMTVSPRSSRGVAAFFRDAQRANAVIVLDGAEIILSNIGSGLMSGMVGCENYTLTYQIEHFRGVVILTCRQQLGYLEINRIPKLRYVIELSVPRAELREKIWKKLVPKKAPMADDIDYKGLAEQFDFTGGEIASSISSAAEQAARKTRGSSLITSEDLFSAGEQEVKRRNISSQPILSIFQ